MHNVSFHIFFLIFCFHISLGCGPLKRKKASEESTSRPPLKEESCDRTEAEWDLWLSQEMSIFRSRSFEINGAHISTVLEQCAPQIDQHPNFAARTQNLRQFTRRIWLLLQDKHTMGMHIPDSEYLEGSASKDAFDIPEELKDQSFLNAVDKANAQDQSAALDWLEKLNQNRPEERRYIAFYYRSQHLPTVDDSQAFGRLFVLAPGDKIDRFIQFGIRDALDKPQPNGISLISLVKEISPTDGTQLASAYYNDLWRLRSPQGIALSTRFKQTQRLENCYGCHSSALVPIVPEKASFKGNLYGSALKKVSTIMASYALAKQPHLNPDDFGPPMGPVTSTQRTDEFIKTCTSPSDLPQIDIQKVKNAMSCASCHNDKIRRALRYPMAGFKQLEKDSLIKQFVEEFQTMPPGSTLNRAERSAVTKCLTAEYIGTSESPGILEQWLTKD